VSDRRICVVTSTRAEYGLLYWLLKELDSAGDVELQLVVTGAHLSPEFGRTVSAIEADGFIAAANVEALVSSDTGVGAAKSAGLTTIGFADALDRLQPAIVVLLGDRYELLAAATAALLLRIPIAHIHGGEVTAGALDEQVRHALTKLASLHFAAARPYADRIIQMGEEPRRVHVVGAPGVDSIARLTLLSREALCEQLGSSLEPPLFLVTYHPATQASLESSVKGARALVSALSEVPEATIVVTGTNADPAGRAVASVLKGFCSGGRAIWVENLGTLPYLSLLAVSDAVVGNSSSGIIEAPALGTPTVNIGPRQEGRLRARSVIDCAADPDVILAALRRATEPGSKQELRDPDPPYGAGGASREMSRILRTIELKGLQWKPFNDWPAAR
jgi:UDP-N-acetylglucosamine 2-epimerase (non-hydrolysing)